MRVKILTNVINPKAKRLNLMQRQFIKAPPKTVFEYLTDPEKLRKWFVSDAMIPKKKGQPYYFEWATGKRCAGNVISFIPGKRFEVPWSERTVVRFSMSPKKGGTILKIDHFGFGDDKWWADNFIGHCSGWAYFAMNIKSYIEFSVDLRSEHYGHSP
jgi:uncharacterized protein YndB with AHSA1/START domain